MKAIIVAAGRGSRMKGLTDERPKCLVELRGRPLLEWQTEALRGAGIDEIAIVTGYKRELLVGRGLHEFHNARWAETNMVSSLACAQTWLEKDTCIVSYSDIFYRSVAPASLVSSAAALAITYDPNWLALWQKRFGDPLVDAEVFLMKPDGNIAQIGAKPKSLDEVQGQYMGLLRFTPAGWGEVVRLRAAMPAITADKMDMTTTLQKVIDAGNVQIKAIPYTDEWGEVDSAEDLAIYS